MTLHDAGNSQEAGSGTGAEQGYPKGRSQPQALWEGSHRRDLDTASVLASDFQQHRVKPSLGSVFAREGLKAPEVSVGKDWLGICSEFHSSGPVLLCVEFN